MTYIDGFVIAVPTANRDRFVRHAQRADSMFMELGALRILECWGDDVPDGKQTDFRRAVQATADESVAFSFVEWPDKPTRDAAMAHLQRLMDDNDNIDPRMDPAKNPMPFDGMRMIFGGFSPVVMLEEPATDQPGDHIWYELMTSDVAAAERFYGDILEWTFDSAPQPGVDYRIIWSGPDCIAGMMTISPEMAERGLEPGWRGYVAVNDMDATLERAQALGGTICAGPMDIPMVGRVATVRDPGGATFCMMQPKRWTRSKAFAEATMAGRCAWNELTSGDQRGAWTFYGDLFGWRQDGEMDMGPMGKYQFIRHRQIIGAILPSGEAAGPPIWTRYFRVRDIDAARAKVEQAGGRVLHGPNEIPGGDFSMNCVDPQGAAFALVGARR